jgi:2-amino-4-hydroxy-6-hydroxymethyldihydropteridine diphosphokinase
MLTGRAGYRWAVEHSYDVIAAIGIGSNLGDRALNLVAGCVAVASFPKTRLLARSAVIETEPVGIGDVDGQSNGASTACEVAGLGGKYLNAAILIRTSLPARELLQALLAAERTQGRIRDARNRFGPRTLDLDLLLYGNESINEPGLCVPHPRLHQRRFVLVPLAQIAPNLVVPGLGMKVRELLSAIDPTALTSV